MPSILWERLDNPGHDACRLVVLDDGWRLAGVAAFEEGGTSSALAYTVECDPSWHTRAARVTGSVGDAPFDLVITHAPAAPWYVNGVAQPGLADLVDLDLGFTPATNLVALRRLGLAIGATAEAPAAYLAFPELRLERLEQTYRRIDETRYHYVARRYDYDDVLVVSPDGFVIDYPRLWRARIS
jgi:hypothetical protein